MGNKRLRKGKEEISNGYFWSIYRLLNRVVRNSTLLEYP